MRVNTIMIPYGQLACIHVTDTVESAIKIINEHGLLSLPVVDDQEFVGVLSKQFLFESYFEEGCSKQEFLEKKVREFMKSKIETIPSDLRPLCSSRPRCGLSPLPTSITSWWGL